MVYTDNRTTIKISMVYSYNRTRIKISMVYSDNRTRIKISIYLQVEFNEMLRYTFIV